MLPIRLQGHNPEETLRKRKYAENNKQRPVYKKERRRVILPGLLRFDSLYTHSVASQHKVQNTT